MRAYLGRSDGKQNREHKHPIFDDPRYKNERRLYPWKNREAGLDALAVMYVYATQIKGATDDDLLTNVPSKFGIKEKKLRNFVRSWVPEVFEEYESCVGRKLSARVCMSRLYNMWRNNQRTNFEFGSEHPKNHPKIAARVTRWSKRIRNGL